MAVVLWFMTKPVLVVPEVGPLQASPDMPTFQRVPSSRQAIDGYRFRLRSERPLRVGNSTSVYASMLDIRWMPFKQLELNH